MKKGKEDELVVRKEKEAFFQKGKDLRTFIRLRDMNGSEREWTFKRRKDNRARSWDWGWGCGDVLGLEEELALDKGEITLL